LRRNATEKDQEKLASAAKVIAESRKHMQMEEKASMDLVKALLKIEVPTF
jgi:hypothetical protein